MAAGRNLAVLLEAAVRNTILQLRALTACRISSTANSASCLTMTRET